MLQESYPYYLAGRACLAGPQLEVTDKYTGRVVTRVSLADGAAIDRAIVAAVEAAGPMRELPSHHRQAVLDHCVRRFTERREELAEVLCTEAGKPIRDARGEVGRLIDTFRIAAEEAVRIGGEVLPLDRTPRGQGYVGMWKRVPVGPCSFITPFNFPLNLAAHKIAPAIAAGCPFVLKPASLTPLGALLIGEVLAEADMPPGAFSIVPCPRAGAALLSEDERLKLLSFTGSAEVGWQLKARAGKKKVTLELGGNAACLVDEDADLDDAVGRIVFGAFYQSGQSCISVQRILVHERVYEPLREKLIAATAALKAGDPHREDTFVGPMITLGDAERIERWIASAVGRGARVLVGGTREGAVMAATLLENVPADEALWAQEAFGPVAVLCTFRDFDQAIAAINDSAFGLQAGLFVRDFRKVLAAWDRIEVGGVVINDVPSWRADHMPYGGSKDSGIGREGVRFAIEEMTDIRMLVVRKG